MKVAAVQMASGPHVSYNLIEAGRLITLAAQAGAELVVLPENFAIMGMAPQDIVKIREPLGKGPIQDFLAEQAEKHGIWIAGGTLPLMADNPKKVRAACLLFNDQGKRVARYDKIHLFDVRIEETKEVYVESAIIEPGNEVHQRALRAHRQNVSPELVDGHGTAVCASAVAGAARSDPADLVARNAAVPARLAAAALFAAQALRRRR